MGWGGLTGNSVPSSSEGSWRESESASSTGRFPSGGQVAAVEVRGRVRVGAVEAEEAVKMSVITGRSGREGKTLAGVATGCIDGEEVEIIYFVWVTWCLEQQDNQRSQVTSLCAYTMARNIKLRTPSLPLGGSIHEHAAAEPCMVCKHRYGL